MSGTISTGTVSVNNGSTTVTGSGTSWANVLKPGWLIKLPDGQFYAIEEVVATDELELTASYQGSNASGAVYLAVPTGAVAQNLADQVGALITDYADVKDNAGEGKFAQGTNAEPSVRGASDQDTGVNMPGGNLLDFVTGGARRGGFTGSGLEMNTPMLGTMAQSAGGDLTAGRLLKVGAGGLLGDAIAVPGDDIDGIAAGGFYKITSAVISASSALSEIPGLTAGSPLLHLKTDTTNAAQLVFQHPDNLLWMRIKDNGTWLDFAPVSPEYGSNASGDFIKFGGVMIAWGVVVGAGTSEVPDGSIYRGGAITFDYPEDFKTGTVPALGVSVNSTQTSWSQPRSLSNESGSARIMTPAADTTNFNLGWHAIGQHA